MTLIQLMAAMQDEMYNAQEEMDKFINGNKSAGTRVRKHMQTIKRAAQNVRTEVQSRIILKIIKGLLAPFFYLFFLYFL